MLKHQAKKGIGAKLRRTAAVSIGLLVLGGIVPMHAAKKPAKIITTADGRPIRKVYLRTGSPQTASSVAADLAKDTCLSVVSSEQEADAVLDLGISLPGIGGGMPIPTVFVPSATAQTLGNAKTKPERTASATCSSGKGGAGCNNSYTLQGGDLGAELPQGFAKSGGARLDVSLISTGPASQELWEPENRTKRSWADQLRSAAGCPVCPGEHFNRRKDKTYRGWIDAKCPAVLTAGGQQ